MADLFDMTARAQRRDRAFRTGPVLFLYERAFADILERLADIRRDFSSALLIGTPDPSWPERLAAMAGPVTALDPGPAFAAAAGGKCVQEDAIDLEPASFDLCVTVGTLDTVNDLPGALLRLRLLLKPDSLLIGVIPGGETLPLLRQAMRAADAATGVASPHVHPRVEPSALAQLLSSAGFAMPVVDVDRVPVSYSSFRQLIDDLRGMGVTNILNARARAPMTRATFAAAEREFENRMADSRPTEVIELVHFAAWAPAEDGSGEIG
jgi:NADH dehydrogenase [ubiquinone] 1 alpha subcomplex assembly factor 5